MEHSDLESLSNLINISGRQRMLSQRIAYLLSINSSSANEKLAEAFELFESSHQLLISDAGNYSSTEQDCEIHDFYFGDRDADNKINQYISIAKVIAKGDVADLNSFSQMAMNEIVPLLNESVQIYESMANKITNEFSEKLTKSNQGLVKTLEEIKNIHRVINVISVNASVLAAKSDNSKEFAVVASEICHLAAKIKTLVEQGLNSLANKKDG